MRRRPKALLDANVLWSHQQRNILLELASHEIIDVAWSELIEDEWLRNLDEQTRARIAARTIPLIRNYFPRVWVAEFDPAAECGLTDVKDRHVAAAAAQVAPCSLVTWNIKHFDEAELAKRDVALQTPDLFLSTLFDGDPELVYHATRFAQENLTKSTPTWDAYLDVLSKHNGLSGLFNGSLGPLWRSTLILPPSSESL